MSEAVVTQESGTIRTEESKSEVKETPKTLTMSEAEAQYKNDFDKKHGRDISKLFPSATPERKEEKVEVSRQLVETKTEPKVEVKTEPTKPKNGFQRAMSRMNRALGAAEERNKQLEARLSAIESTKVTPQVTTRIEAVIEPKREDFQTVEEYITAIRKYDRTQLVAETDKKLLTRDEEDMQAVAAERWNSFVVKRDELKKTLPDYDEVIDKSTVEFNPLLGGLIVSLGNEDPKFFYDLAKTPKEAKKLNELNEAAIVAVGISDNISGVMRYLSANPADISKLNSLDSVKATKFIGIIESKLETPVKMELKTEEKAPLPAELASQKSEIKTPEMVEPARRTKPEIPPKISGSAPTSTDWRDSTEMSFVEFERLYREDPRNKRR